MTSISDNVLQAIKDSVKAEIITIDGVQYATRDVTDVRKPLPEAKTIALNTLRGFVDYIQAPKLMPEQKAFIGSRIHIVGHDVVELISEPFGRFKQIDVFARAAFRNLFGNGFAFNSYHDSEVFLVSLLTLFEDTPGRAEILALVGNISDESVQTHADNGVAQTVTARTGIALAKPVIVPSLVVLRPFRTFRELEQPASNFILRMKQHPGGGKPLCALYEADGGKWKLEAIDLISAYIKNAGIAIPIIA